MFDNVSDVADLVSSNNTCSLGAPCFITVSSLFLKKFSLNYSQLHLVLLAFDLFPPPRFTGPASEQTSPALQLSLETHLPSHLQPLRTKSPVIKSSTSAPSLFLFLATPPKKKQCANTPTPSTPAPASTSSAPPNTAPPPSLHPPLRPKTHGSPSSPSRKPATKITTSSSTMMVTSICKRRGSSNPR